MVYSMTGYGAGEADINGILFRVELRALNSKGLDVNIKLPSSLKSFESTLRQGLNQLQRGKIECLVTESSVAKVSDKVLNQALLQQYFDQVNQFASQNKISTSDILPALLSMNDIWSEQQIISEDYSKDLENLVQQAISSLNQFRQAEGEMLAQEVMQRVMLIKNLLAEITPFEEARTQKIKERISKELQQLAKEVQADPGRLEVEMIFYMEKLDISEEKLRLATHCNYFEEVLSDNSQIEKGKKLGFITQEMGREVNTIGSKANDAQLQRIVVLMKDELEKIKEQTSNIL